MKSIAIFAIAAVVGPLLRLLMLPPSDFKATAFGNNFFYHFVFLIWPTQPLAVIEIYAGSGAAIALAIVSNITIYGAIGFAASLKKQTSWLTGVYIVLVVLVFLMAWWASGFSVSHLDILALVTAAGFYAVPFWILNKATISRRIVGDEWRIRPQP